MQEKSSEAATLWCFIQKTFSLEKLTVKKTVGVLSCLPETSNFIEKETLNQMFFFYIFEIFKINFFIEHLWLLLLKYFIDMSLS